MMKVDGIVLGYAFVSSLVSAAGAFTTVNLQIRNNLQHLSRTACTVLPTGDDHIIEPSDFQDQHREHQDNSKRNLLKFLANGVGASVVLPSFVSPALAMYTDPNSKILLPSEGEIQSSLPTTWDKDDNPFVDLDKSSFSRLDETPDTKFYQDPRFTEHVDEQAVQSMTNFIASNDVLKENDSVLDMCSSWTSHISPSTKAKYNLERVAGLGMNEEELKSNSILNNDYTAVDLNTKPDVKLPYDDESFNVVLCQLSIDYLIHPLNIMREVGRILKPGGKVIIIFSNRLFLQKAVGLWTGKDDVDHVYTVASYLNYCQDGLFTKIMARDLSVREKKKGRGGERMVVGEPLYAVIGEKASS